MHFSVTEPAELLKRTWVALDRIGVPDSKDTSSNVIEGEIPPFRVRASYDPSTRWITFAGLGRSKTAWTFDAEESEWRADGGRSAQGAGEDIRMAVLTWAKLTSRGLLPHPSPDQVHAPAPDERGEKR